MTTKDIDVAFEALVTSVGACTACPRMCESKRVLNRGCGPLTARVMIIGEAPGRLGADSSELPFHGDKSGHNFEALLEVAGIRRSDVFITNAVLCNPRDHVGNNATPTEIEIVNCSRNLKRQIDLLQPAIVVTLGATALRAASYVEKHDLTLRAAVRTSTQWYGRELIPLYHPGQRAMIHRSFANQSADYQFLAERVRRLGVARRRVTGRAKPDIAKVASAILERGGPRSYFALHKLAYLAEYYFCREYRLRMTDAYFIRQKDGPYCVDLHPERLRRAESSIHIERTRAGQLLLSKKQSLFGQPATQPLPGEQLKVIDEVLARYGTLPEERLKTVAYLTAPMRKLLRQERQGTNRFNAPILFLNEADQ